MKLKHIFNTIVVSCIFLSGANHCYALVIPLDPGPIGTTYGSVDFPITALDGTVATGQTITVDILFPTGIDAVYRFPTGGTRQLYGWHFGLNFSGGVTVTTQPNVSGVVPLDANSNPIGFQWPTGTFFNAGTSNYGANYNSTFSLPQLIAFTDVLYHGVRLNLHLPAYAESNVIVTSGNFGFRRNGSSDFTEIVQAVPEPSTFALTAFAILGLVIRRWRKREKNSYN